MDMSTKQDDADPSFSAVQRLAREYDELRAENQRLARRSEHFEKNWHSAEYVIRLRAAENERLRMALRQALEKAKACAPVGRLHELDPLWAVLEDS